MLDREWLLIADALERVLFRGALDGEWEEGKHPRVKSGRGGGQFTKGSGGGPAPKRLNQLHGRLSKVQELGVHAVRKARALDKPNEQISRSNLSPEVKSIAHHLTDTKDRVAVQGRAHKQIGQSTFLEHKIAEQLAKASGGTRYDRMKRAELLKELKDHGEAMGLSKAKREDLAKRLMSREVNEHSPIKQELSATMPKKAGKAPANPFAKREDPHKQFSAEQHRHNLTEAAKLAISSGRADPVAFANTVRSAMVEGKSLEEAIELSLKKNLQRPARPATKPKRPTATVSDPNLAGKVNEFFDRAGDRVEIFVKKHGPDIAEAGRRFATGYTAGKTIGISKLFKPKEAPAPAQKKPKSAKSKAASTKNQKTAKDRSLTRQQGAYVAAELF